MTAAFCGDVGSESDTPTHATPAFSFSSARCDSGKRPAGKSNSVKSVGSSKLRRRNRDGKARPPNRSAVFCNPPPLLLHLDRAFQRPDVCWFCRRFSLTNRARVQAFLSLFYPPSLDLDHHRSDSALREMCSLLGSFLNGRNFHIP